MKVKLKTQNIYVLKLTQEEIERLYILSYRNECGKGFPLVDEGRLHQYIPEHVAKTAIARFNHE